MSLIMLKRMIIIITGPWKLTIQDWIQIKNSFEFIHLTLAKANGSTQMKWQMMLILVVLKSKDGKLKNSDILHQLRNTHIKSVFEVC